MEQRNTTRLVKTTCRPDDDSGQTHLPAPFYLSTKGYGVFLNTNSYSYFDVGFSNATEVLMETEDPVVNYFVLLADSVQAGPKQLLSNFTALTGRMRMPPRNHLGVWWRASTHWDGNTTLNHTAQWQEKKIPLDVVGLEPVWQTHSYPCSYVWNAQKFGAMEDFMQRMHGMNLSVNLWEHAYVHPSSPIYSALNSTSPRGVSDWITWGGLTPDFTQPTTSKIFSDYHVQHLLKLGVSSFKLDEDDGDGLGPDAHGTHWFFPDNASFPASGFRGHNMHNVFAYLYQQTFHKMFLSQGRRTMLMCRANYAGGGGYPTVAYSDTYNFGQYLRALATSGFSAMMWAPEIRNPGGQTADQFMRRVQLGALSWLFQLDGWDDGALPWSFGAQTQEVFTRYASLRLALQPYMYSGWWQMHQSGMPLIRAVAFDNPLDIEASNVDDEFLFGMGMLVAPVSGDSAISALNRSVYLPSGKWCDYWNHSQIFTGPTRFEFPADIATLPIFVRSGTIIPFAPPGQLYTDEKPIDLMTLHIYVLEGSINTGENTVSEFELFEDDGLSTSYDSASAFSTIMFQWTPAAQDGAGLLCIGARSGAFQGMPQERSFKLIFVGAKSASGDTKDMQQTLQYTGSEICVSPADDQQAAFV